MGLLKDRWKYKQPLYMPENPEPPEPIEPDIYQQSKQPKEPSQDQYEDVPSKDTSPLAVLDEIKRSPSPKGAYPTLIGGRPIDLHDLEDYLLKISPYALKTILRYHNARTIEEIKGYAKGLGGSKFNFRFILLILLAVGMAVIGILVLLYMPQIMAFFKGFAGGT